MDTKTKVGIVIIGRNEGERLVKCLAAINQESCHIVYVDSNSSDNSVDNAHKAGAKVINLDMSKPFSAARARNTGWQFLLAQYPDIEFIQFIDGDCELQSNWLEQAQNFLTANSQYAVVCGRRRERYPNATLYNRFCDDEWNTPVGDALACGGDALIRSKCLIEVDGYKDFFVAGEEPEMCYRLRKNGWRICRLDEEMVLHDANMTKFSQWWQRAKRSGFAAALAAKEHGMGSERFGMREALRPLVWSGMFVCIILISIFIPVFSLALFIFPVQITRMFLRRKNRDLYSLVSCVFLMLGKLPEALGVAALLAKTLRKQPYTIIEYK
jgi:glycosyltransferase involved in cell wall biosynthesis